MNEQPPEKGTDFKRIRFPAGEGAGNGNRKARRAAKSYARKNKKRMDAIVRSHVQTRKEST